MNLLDADVSLLDRLLRRWYVAIIILLPVQSTPEPAQLDAFGAGVVLAASSTLEDNFGYRFPGVGDYIPVRDAEIVPDTITTATISTNTAIGGALFVWRRSEVLRRQSPFFALGSFLVGVEEGG